MRRVAVRVPLQRAEEARALMLELAPEGFEELQRGDELELAAYTDGVGGARIARAFGVAREDEVVADWRERWRAFHHPVRAGRFWVGASWENAPDDAIGIVIDPGLAFGTGAHPTTRLCLELLDALPRTSLLDAGCGSGVLAIAGARLGFAPVYAVDDDRFAVETTHANAAQNGVTVEVVHADITRDELPETDVVVANIAIDAVEALAARAHVRGLVTSGYLVAEQPDVPRLEHVERRVLAGWAADRFGA